MKKGLYIDCCIRRENSRSKELAEFFIDQLEKTGKYNVERLCLMDENLSYFSDGFFLFAILYPRISIAQIILSVYRLCTMQFLLTV